VRLLYHGKPLEGAEVIAFSKDKPMQKERVRTDKAGMASISLPHKGLWLIKVVKMIRASKDLKDAQWESFWASLVFEI